MSKSSLHPVIAQVTNNIIARSKLTRDAYLSKMKAHYGKKVKRSSLSCTNLAHAIAAQDAPTKFRLQQLEQPNIAIVTAYNDMLSAHQPYYDYPVRIKQSALKYGATAQVAGSVPAMCDGITQGQAGMELSLFSRDVIALATAISLSHNVFDGVLCLGICDKIVPGLLIGALQFGYLPTIFIPSGPMASGISNQQKATTRKLYAQGIVGDKELLASELQSYHSAGTCTFYGTANSNQMLMEIMGLHVPGSAFVAPNSPLRYLLTDFAVQRLCDSVHTNNNTNGNTTSFEDKQANQQFIPLCEVVTEKTLVNAIIGLVATGGSTNHTLHIPAIARACGIIINWDDFAQISRVVPLLAKVYPNGDADVNQFHQAGGVAYVIKELLGANLLHDDVMTIMGYGLGNFYTKNPSLVATSMAKPQSNYNNDHKSNYNNSNDSSQDFLCWQEAANLDNNILRNTQNPFSHEGGIRVLEGNLGRAIAKISAISADHHYVKAPAYVFDTQEAVLASYHAGELNNDCIVVLRYQGAKANGMPELHGLTPALTSLQDKGYKIGLVTDGRMSGASGKVPHAIHLTPETIAKGNLGKIQNGDLIELDLINGILQVELTTEELAKREYHQANLSENQHGMGRELFAIFRHHASDAESGCLTSI